MHVAHVAYLISTISGQVVGGPTRADPSDRWFDVSQAHEAQVICERDAGCEGWCINGEPTNGDCVEAEFTSHTNGSASNVADQHCYRLYPGKMTHLDATAFCNADACEGCHLVTISSAAENHVVARLCAQGADANAGCVLGVHERPGTDKE